VPFTLADLVAVPSLGLTVLAGADALDQSVQWAHVSELADPTPFLEGGELLLTVGLWSGENVSAGDYVARLAAAGAVGLAFGVGPALADVPPDLVAAAERASFPLLVVPGPTPFIAVSKVVSQALAAEQYEEITRGFRQQQRLTQAAVGEGGAAEVVAQVAGELGGWALLLDAAGGVRTAHPAAAAARGAALEAHLGRLRTATAPASVALADVTEHVLLLPLMISRRVRGYLAVGTAARLTPAERQLVTATASMLTLLLEQATALRSTEGRFRTAVFRLLVTGDVDAARRPATDLWGGLPEDPLTVLVVAGGADDRSNLAEVAEASARHGERTFFADVDDRLVVLLNAGGRARARVVEALGALSGVTAGESSPVPLPELARGMQEAEQALAAGRRLGRRHTTFSDVGADGLLALVSTPDGRAFAEAVLRPLRDEDGHARGELVASLRAWLEHNGHWDGAAATLGVHRHTLRSRIRRIEGLLDRSLDAPGVRAELWTALRLLDRMEP
jgi:PucR family transcriptional regulator, purine catabolism regulatory protein